MWRVLGGVDPGGGSSIYVAWASNNHLLMKMLKEVESFKGSQGLFIRYMSCFREPILSPSHHPPHCKTTPQYSASISECPLATAPEDLEVIAVSWGWPTE